MVSKRGGSISNPDRWQLWQSSAGRCAYPGCRIKLSVKGNELDGPATIGEVAHIFAQSARGPRPNPAGVTEETHAYDNLILLCPNHHRQVDMQPNTYTVDDLRQWKAAHERWVDDRLRTAEFNSAHLEEIITWLANNSAGISLDDLTLIRLEDKIAINSFSPRVRNHISMATVRVKEVERYIEHQARIDEKYPDRLLNPLKSRYVELKSSQFDSDSVFFGLRQFACGESLEFDFQLAGLVLIVYFFERCDIFER